MKKQFLSLLFTFFVVISFQAQKLEKSLLWEISGNGLEQSSYLFGTIHMSCDATLDDNIKNALDKTSLLVLEIDMDDPNMQMDMMKGVYMKDGKTLKDFVNDEDYKILESFLKEQTGMPIGLIGNIKPFFISAMMYPKLLDCAVVQSLENELMKVAHEQEEEVLGLESIEEQLNVFDEIPYEDQVKDLLESAKNNLVDEKADFQELLNLYKLKDLNAMLKLMDKDDNLTTSKHSDKLLVNRNKNWISKMEEFTKGQPTFFGVGAAHLPGENGVINLLRKKGYIVKAVL